MKPQSPFDNRASLSGRNHCHFGSGGTALIADAITSPSIAAIRSHRTLTILGRWSENNTSRLTRSAIGTTIIPASETTITERFAPGGEM